MNAKEQKKLLQHLKETLEEAQKAIKENGQEALKGAFVDLFETYPDLLEVRWSQYTPYFNDGNECVFRVNEPYIRVVGVPEDAGDHEDGFVDVWGDKVYGIEDAEVTKKCIKAMKLVNGLFKPLDKDLMYLIFGDHVQVTASVDGFEVERYDHE